MYSHKIASVYDALIRDNGKRDERHSEARKMDEKKRSFNRNDV